MILSLQVEPSQLTAVENSDSNNYISQRKKKSHSQFFPYQSRNTSFQTFPTSTTYFFPNKSHISIKNTVASLSQKIIKCRNLFFFPPKICRCTLNVSFIPMSFFEADFFTQPPLSQRQHLLSLCCRDGRFLPLMCCCKEPSSPVMCHSAAQEL